MRVFMALRNQDIGERIANLRAERGNPPQPVVADAVGVSLRALQLWEAGEAKPRYENLEALAKYYAVSEEYILTGTEKAETPNPFRISDQVEDVRDEFRTDVTAIQERLTAIEASLKVAQDDRVSLRAAIEQQNRLLAEQSTLLARIEHLVAVLEGAELETSGEAGAGDAGEAPPLPDPDVLLEPREPERPERTTRARAARSAGRRRKSA